MKSMLWRMLFTVGSCALVLLIITQSGALSAQEQDFNPPPGQLTETMQRFMADHMPAEPLSPLGATPCVAGQAGSYPCNNVDLLAFMPLATIGGGEGNDIWGWTDPLTNKEYAIMGRTNGTAFVDISDPVNPIYLGNLPTQTSNSSWRDIKVYANHAFIVSEAGGHGIQVFDLTRLRNVPTPPATFTVDAHYPGFGNAHNIVINEDSGYAYGVGTSTCSGGLHMVNIQNPLAPTNAGCFSADGYTHDAQCVIYAGLDVTHQGKEICFNSNEDSVTVVDVTNKSLPVQLARKTYTGSSYTHQGWVTEDQRYLLVDDEGDELDYGHNTRTYIWDIADLDNPVLIGNYTAGAGVNSIDHNLYVKGNFAFAANYRSGLRILDITNIASATLTEAAFFDIYPSNNSPSYNGAWSVYPYFASGVVVVSGIEQGLFILDPHVGPEYDAQLLSGDSNAAALPGDHATHTFVLENTGQNNDSYTLAITGDDWHATLMTATPLSVAAGMTATITIEVHVPVNAAAAQDTFTLTITSTNDPNLSLTATGTTFFNQMFLPALLKP